MFMSRAIKKIVSELMSSCSPDEVNPETNVMDPFKVEAF